MVLKHSHVAEKTVDLSYITWMLRKEEEIRLKGIYMDLPGFTHLHSFTSGPTTT